MSRADRPRQSHRPLALETLEDRSLPAGNVVAAVTEGLLTLLGDASPNSVTVSYDYTTGQTFVSGNPLGGSATLVNGQDTTFGPFPFAGVTGWQVRMGEGDDQFFVGTPVLTYTRVGGRMDFDMGSGNDSLTIGQAGNFPGAADPIRSIVSVGNGSYIDLGEGNDTLYVANTQLGNSLVIEARGGDDQVNFPTEFTPSGATTPTISPVLVKGNLIVRLGEGTDTLTGKHVGASQNFSISDSGGPTTINLADLKAKKTLQIDTASDIDHVAVDYFFAKQFNLNTRGGADVVDLAHGSVKRTKLNLGDDRDSLRLRATRSSQYTLLDGGSGGSSVSMSSNVLRGLLRRRLG